MIIIIIIIIAGRGPKAASKISFSASSALSLNSPLTCRSACYFVYFLAKS